MSRCHHTSAMNRLPHPSRGTRGALGERRKRIQRARVPRGEWRGTEFRRRYSNTSKATLARGLEPGHEPLGLRLDRGVPADRAGRIGTREDGRERARRRWRSHGWVLTEEEDRRSRSSSRTMHYARLRLSAHPTLDPCNGRSSSHTCNTLIDSPRIVNSITTTTKCSIHSNLYARCQTCMLRLRMKLGVSPDSNRVGNSLARFLVLSSSRRTGVFRHYSGIPIT